MAKFVCDFDTVQTYINEINEYIESLNEKITTLETNVSDATINWKGVASDTFKEAISIKIANLKNVSAELKELTTFLSDSVTKINETESELASLTI